jgi:sporulation protein YlmC with PRC-barrel domain
MGQQQHIKASKIEGAKVTSSSGQEVGTVQDVIINPMSGRVEFAILSVSSAGATSSSTPGATTTTPGATRTTPGATTTTPGATTTTPGGLTGSGNQVAVPWMLLRTGGAGTSSSSVTSATRGAGADSVNFVFSGDTSKLQNAPRFNESTDLSQPNWRQSVYSHYGLTSGAATGGSYSPGGRTTGSSTDLDRPGSSTTDPNRSSTDPTQPRSGSSGLGTGGSTTGGSSSDRDNR